MPLGNFNGTWRNWKWMARHQDLGHAQGINLVDERINPTMKTAHAGLLASKKVY